MTFPYATKSLKAWIIIGEQGPELKHAVKLILQSPIEAIVPSTEKKLHKILVNKIFVMTKLQKFSTTKNCNYTVIFKQIIITAHPLTFKNI